eukprot:m.1430125 g.1430125  ORF g.1430125 m.1430125 type:complete len:148 (+) comp25071_c0_seq5:3195-3638(+)
MCVRAWMREFIGVCVFMCAPCVFVWVRLSLRVCVSMCSHMCVGRQASGTYATHRGIVAVSWARETDGAGGARTFALNVTIPPNMVATVHVPHMAGAVVFEHGPGDTGPDAWQRLERRRFHTVSARSGVYDADVLTVGSGVHRFKTML